MMSPDTIASEPFAQDAVLPVRIRALLMNLSTSRSIAVPVPTAVADCPVARDTAADASVGA